MDSVDDIRRKSLQAAVAALCVEVGYMTADRGAIETLTQLLQSYISEIGKTSRCFSEIAQRSDPTVSDVQLALIDLGSKVTKLDDYSRRPQRRHLPRQLRNLPQPQTKVLQVGSKKPRPPHILPHLPSYPDTHTYIKTPTYTIPHTDYRIVREKLATQNSHSTQSLSCLLAKTRPSHLIAGDIDDEGLYTVLVPTSSDVPAYIQALMPTDEDRSEPSLNQSVNNEEDMPDPTDQLDYDEIKTDIASTSGGDHVIYQNPFLKPPRRLRNFSVDLTHVTNI